MGDHLFDEAEASLLIDGEADVEDQGQWPAGQVLSLEADRKPLQDPLDGERRGECWRDGVRRQQPIARAEDAAHLGQRRGLVGDVAHGKRAHDRVQRGIGKAQRERVASL